MNVRQMYTGCLAQAAYFIESGGEAAIIDPLRDTDEYIRLADKFSAKIKYIFETHFHADFVSGHLELAEKTGAKIVYGPGAKAAYEFHEATDGETFTLGSISLTLLHTPGHTMESSCILLKDEAGNLNSIFTGDTLFIGDVGRPDLAVKSNLSKEDLAAHLYHSIHSKILPLPDNILVYPGHGAGSACGKNLSSETTDTLGNQKKFNYALQPMSVTEFIHKVLDGLSPAPMYFPQNAAINKTGYETMQEVYKRALKPLNADEFERISEESDVLILDTRNAASFAESHITDSIQIGLEGPFAPWVGTLIPEVHHRLLLVTENGQEAETVKRLSRIGFDHVEGYLDGGMKTWIAAGKKTESIRQIGPDEFALVCNGESTMILDIRRPAEYEAEHIHTATNYPLDYVSDWVDKLDKDKHFYLHCAGGYRSMIAASILKTKGVNFTEVKGGFSVIKNHLNQDWIR